MLFSHDPIWHHCRLAGDAGFFDPSSGCGSKLFCRNLEGELGWHLDMSPHWMLPAARAHPVIRWIQKLIHPKPRNIEHSRYCPSLGLPCVGIGSPFHLSIVSKQQFLLWIVSLCKTLDFIVSDNFIVVQNSVSASAPRNLNIQDWNMEKESCLWTSFNILKNTPSNIFWTVIEKPLQKEMIKGNSSGHYILSNWWKENSFTNFNLNHLGRNLLFTNRYVFIDHVTNYCEIVRMRMYTLVFRVNHVISYYEKEDVHIRVLKKFIIKFRKI